MVYVTLVGNLCDAPKAFKKADGKTSCLLRIGAGTKDKPLFISAWVYGFSADFSMKFLQKGDKVAVNGTLSQREWVAKDGTKQTVLEVIGNTIEGCSAKSSR